MIGPERRIRSRFNQVTPATDKRLGSVIDGVIRLMQERCGETALGVWRFCSVENVFGLFGYLRNLWNKYCWFEPLILMHESEPPR